MDAVAVPVWIVPQQTTYSGPIAIAFLLGYPAPPSLSTGRTSGISSRVNPIAARSRRR
jgi:hypothetical protein